ncbi:hypothetical protein GCM10009788_11720 [Nocardioides humi]|uniref:Uncharacterized protein n=1 Tax=Nocardioides humi TaxID=449461 RepID=A0ABN2A2A0_9ACTN
MRVGEADPLPLVCGECAGAADERTIRRPPLASVRKKAGSAAQARRYGAARLRSHNCHSGWASHAVVRGCNP